MFFNSTSHAKLFPLSLHDALPISDLERAPQVDRLEDLAADALLVLGMDHGGEGHHAVLDQRLGRIAQHRSEEHTSELQSHVNLVCRLLLEKNKNDENNMFIIRQDT